MDRVAPLSFRRRHTTGIVLFIAALGLVLRATSLDLVAFGSDEALLAIAGLQTAALRNLPAYGAPTSFGFHNPALLVYLVAPFFWISKDPRFAMLAFATLGAAAVVLAAFTARRLWGNRAALAVAVLMAFSPDAVEHCRRLWGHDMIVFWSALSVYAAVRGVQEERSRWLGLSMVCAAAAQACHLSGILLWVPPLGALILFSPPRRWRALGAGMLALLAIYLPWFLWDAVGNHFAELGIAFELISGRHAVAHRPSPVPPFLVWLTILSDGWHNDHLAAEYGRFLSDARWFGVLMALSRFISACALALGAAALALAALARKPQYRDSAAWSALILASAVAPPVVFSLLPTVTVPPYQLPALVPAAMAGGFLLSRRGRRPPPQARQRGVLLLIPGMLGRALALIALLFIAAFGPFYTLRARRCLANATDRDRMTTTLRAEIGAMDYITRSTGERPYAIMQDARAVRTGIDYWVVYLHFWISGNPEVPLDRSAPTLFAIHDAKTILRPEIAEWLDGKSRVAFGTLAVFRFEEKEARLWRDLVERFSATSPPEAPASAE
ncbi:MAG TPA: glycosyltransferase family 39 protein [Sumerlaeia bacterium]|nr:glycosyltransferase family 39 protein [Sumerlaeia bacterium]